MAEFRRHLSDSVLYHREPKDTQVTVMQMPRLRGSARRGEKEEAVAELAFYNREIFVCVVSKIS